jgi:hypothetical protein
VKTDATDLAEHLNELIIALTCSVTMGHSATCNGTDFSRLSGSD